ncbi:uncharacterized protein SETTUDRAFT_169686, partial [Exserohilum turcica Et28A]
MASSSTAISATTANPVSGTTGSVELGGKMISNSCALHRVSKNDCTANVKGEEAVAKCTLSDHCTLERLPRGEPPRPGRPSPPTSGRPEPPDGPAPPRAGRPEPPTSGRPEPPAIGRPEPPTSGRPDELEPPGEPEPAPSTGKPEPPPRRGSLLPRPKPPSWGLGYAVTTLTRARIWAM